MPVNQETIWLNTSNICAQLSGFCNVDYKIPGLSVVPWTQINIGIVGRVYLNSQTIGNCTSMDRDNIIVGTPGRFGLYGDNGLFVGTKGHLVVSTYEGPRNPNRATIGTHSWGTGDDRTATITIERDVYTTTNGGTVNVAESMGTSWISNNNPNICVGYSRDDNQTYAVVCCFNIKRDLNLTTGSRYKIGGRFKSVDITSYDINQFDIDIKSTNIDGSPFTNDSVMANICNSNQDVLGWRGINITWPWSSHKLAVVGVGFTVISPP